MNQLFLGIDLGTSAMKLVLVDGEKRVLAQICEEYLVEQPNSEWNEIDPEVWYQCMMSGMEKILEGQDKSLVKGIGVTGQMHTLVVLDEQGKVVRPAMMWNDTRTKELIPEMKETMAGFVDGEYLSRTISTGSPAANLYWLKLHEPENFEKIRMFLIGPDYLVYRLTGNYSTDYCEASTSCLYQMKERMWSEEMRNFLGLSKDVYPPVHGSALPAGKVKQEVAERLSFGDDVSVLVGTGDNPATAISTGCLGLGYPVISLGTSGVLVMPVAQPEAQAKGKMILFSFDDASFSYLVQGTLQSNGSTFDWWVKNIMGDEEYKEVDITMDAERAAANVIFYPHLMGDKTLYADPNIRGAFIGLGPETDRAGMLYAVMEGLCFGFRELAETMRLPLHNFESVKVVGGGSRNHIWMQTLANVLNIRIEKLDGMIGPAFGIAMLAAYEGGSVHSLEKISEGAIKTDQVFEPEPEAVERCEAKYKRYVRIHRALAYIDGNMEE